MRELLIKRCKKCGSIVRIIKDCDCSKGNGICCCGDMMDTVDFNSVDAAIEKHMPDITINGNKIIVKVNHVMEDEHYIEWIAMSNDEMEVIKYLQPGKEAVVEFDYIKGSYIYAYCNKHGLWRKEI